MDKQKSTIPIPTGVYCYDENGRCPYWAILKDKPLHHNGFCSFLGKGDWELDCSLLWDEIKECGVKFE